MTTTLDRYVEIVDRAGSGDSIPDDLHGLLAEDVVLMHSANMLRGRAAAVDLHRTQAAKWKSARHHWTAAGTAADGSLTGTWTRAGVPPRGNSCSGAGRVSASLAPDGRISRLHLRLTGGSDRARVLIARHLAVWMTPDPDARAEAMEGVYAEDITVMEPDRVFVGRGALSDCIGVVQRQAPPLSGLVVSHAQRRELVHRSWDFAISGGKSALGSAIRPCDGDMIEKVVILSADMDVDTRRHRGAAVAAATPHRVRTGPAYAPCKRAPGVRAGRGSCGCRSASWGVWSVYGTGAVWWPRRTAAPTDRPACRTPQAAGPRVV
ncbi:hypothetical protein PV392_25740 [Streptomyces sp. ME03-5709C]|nr:hypothetical protein [Streptomyces sp. ME03-5709C]